MIRLIAALFLVFSIAVSPAIADSCAPFDQKTTSIEMQHSNPDDSGKKDMAAHHCASCHQHVSDRAIATMEPVSLASVSSVVSFSVNSLAASIITGPLLEPPAHA